MFTDVSEEHTASISSLPVWQRWKMGFHNVKRSCISVCSCWWQSTWRRQGEEPIAWRGILTEAEACSTQYLWSYFNLWYNPLEIISYSPKLRHTCRKPVPHHILRGCEKAVYVQRRKHYQRCGIWSVQDERLDCGLLYAFHITHVCATCLSHLIFIDSNTLIISGE
jgi:hypothetical protein